MLEIIIIDPKEEKPIVTKGDFAFVVTDPADGESNVIFMGSGRMSDVVTTLGGSPAGGLSKTLLRVIRCFAPR